MKAKDTALYIRVSYPFKARVRRWISHKPDTDLSKIIRGFLESEMQKYSESRRKVRRS